MPEKARVCPLSELRDSFASKEAKILDVRSPAEFAGNADETSDSEGRRTGHIPGAANLEWSELLQPDGTYKDPATIRDLLKAKGVSPEDTVVVHCQAGGRASAAVFALELAGFEHVENYYAGWSQYGADADLPVERGDEGAAP